MRHISAWLLVVFVLMLLAAGCAREGTADKVIVAVTIPPQAEFVRQVGGENVEVTVMVPAGASPHTYEPSPSQIVALSQAKIYAKVGSGIDFELGWMDKLKEANQDMLVIDCSRGIEMGDTGESEEENGGVHAHGGIDPHIWMSPINAGVMVQNITEGMVQLDPDEREFYEGNRDEYIGKLEPLDSQIREELFGITKRAFMVDHASFGYFAREYGLHMIAIEEGDKEPGATRMARLIEEAREHGIETIFVSPQANPQNARVIADSIGAEIVHFDPLAENYLDNMKKLATELGKALK